MRTKLGIGSALAALMLALSAAGMAHADDDHKRFTVGPATYQQECGGCHLAYPAELLSAQSWRAVMAGLDKHFGSDASLDPATSSELTTFLVSHAGRRASLDKAGQPLLRISETSWFRKEHRDGHDGITAGVFQSPEVRSAGNCSACHRAAAEGDYSERGIRIPTMASGR